MPADDLTDPAPATTFAHLDATTVLSRSIAELGIYPAVDPLDSTSRILDPSVVGQRHYGVARGVQKILQDYKNLQVRCKSCAVRTRFFVGVLGAKLLRVGLLRTFRNFVLVMGFVLLQ